MKRNIIHESNAKLKAGKRGLFLLLVSFSILNGLQAQITIGSDLPPAEGALLDLKQHEANERGATSDKGILFPRVALVSLDSLEPLTKDAAQTGKHKGTLIYNTTVSPQKKLKEGLYYWDGGTWTPAQGGDANAWRMTGNAGTNSATNYLGTSDNQPLILKTNGQEGLRISPEGTVHIANAEELAINTEVLVRNKVGKIGLKQADEKVPALLMFLQSEDYQFYKAGKPADAKTAAEFNKGGIAHLLTVGWKVHDVLINNAVDYDSAKEPFSEFTIRQSGVYEMSGYVLYKTNCELKAGFASAKNAADCFRNNYAGVIVAIQYKEPQAAQWINTTTTLQIWPLGAINYTLTVAVPPVVKHLNAGDKLRMVFYRPSENFGLPHGNSGKVYDGDTEGTFGIYSADGIEAVRSFKIVGIN